MNIRVFGFCFAVLAGVFWAAAETINFSQLTVKPYGSQEFDISTGITTLPEGGDVIDTNTNLSLSGSFVRFEDGAFIEATEVTITGNFGTLQSSEVYLDLHSSTLDIPNALTFNRAELQLEAGAMKYHHEHGIAVFTGGVSGTVPPLQADTVMLDSVTGTMLLVGTYTFTDGLFTLESPSGGGYLFVTIEVDEETNETDYIATSNPTESDLERFASFLE